MAYMSLSDNCVVSVAVADIFWWEKDLKCQLWFMSFGRGFWRRIRDPYCCHVTVTLSFL